MRRVQADVRNSSRILSDSGTIRDSFAAAWRLGEGGRVTKYHRVVSRVQEYLVSSSGQMQLPASARHRWNLDHGGPVDVIDLGFGVLTVPLGTAQGLLGDLLSRDEHAEFVNSLADDVDLATT